MSKTVIFQTIQFSISTQFSSIRPYQFIVQFISLQFSSIRPYQVLPLLARVFQCNMNNFHTAVWFQMTNNKIPQKIIEQFIIPFDSQIGPKQVLPLRIRVVLRAIDIKMYSTFSKALRLEPHRQMQFSFIPRTLVEGGYLTPLQRCSRHIVQFQPPGRSECIYIYIYIYRDELISDVLLWTPLHAGCPAPNYIQQLCADTGCSPEDLQEAMDNREVWREEVRNTRADSAT